MATNKINKFKQIAEEELSLSPLMTGREQLKTDDLIGKEVTVIAFDFATITDKGEEKTFPVMLPQGIPRSLLQRWHSAVEVVSGLGQRLRRRR